VNTQAILNNQDDAFRQFLMISVILHLSFVVVTAVKGFLLPDRTLIIQNAVRVDMVALPDKLPESPAPSAAAPTPKAEKSPPVKELPKETPKANLKNMQETQKKALEKLRAMEALEKIKNEVAQKQKPAAAGTNSPNTTPTVPQYKGNIISSGNSFTGMSRLRVNEYLEDLTARIRDHWVLPQWLSDAKLKAAVVIEVDARGHLIRKEIHTSSGNSVFDSSCLAAVVDASPFVNPPDEVKEALIMIRFPFE
jgi:colicin import membrane protein